jgi:hypothetical protein
LKAGKNGSSLGNKADALKYFTDIKRKYEATQKLKPVDVLIRISAIKMI